jgi:hypothetical protein
MLASAGLVATAVDLELTKLDGTLAVICTIGSWLTALATRLPGIRRRRMDRESERAWPGGDDGPALPGEPAEDYHVPEPYEPEEAGPLPPDQVAAADTQGMGEGG